MCHSLAVKLIPWIYESKQTSIIDHPRNINENIIRSIISVVFIVYVYTGSDKVLGLPSQLGAVLSQTELDVDSRNTESWDIGRT